jgi:hypothetical protein
MIRLQVKSPYWALVIIALAVGACLPEMCATEPPQSPSGGASGTVSRIVADRIVPAAEVRLSVSSTADPQKEYQAVTDQAGQYTVSLPAGTYRTRLHWFGDCSEIHRAPFTLGSGEHLTFDFIVVACPASHPVKRELSLEEPETSGTAAKMNVPLADQTDKYQEQVIPAERNQWPEIVISFGKCDNQGDRIQYFPLQNQKVINRTSTPVIMLSLPVTVSVDRYTLRASSVFLDKKTMVFEATGDVSVSDGKSKRTAASATLSFPSGLPKLTIKR